MIFGSKGYFGRHFVSVFPDAETPSVDIGDAGAVAAVLDDKKPDVVINAAGKTGVPNVDWCEDHKEETLHSNVKGPLVLLEECGKRAIYWVHLGSGCIYEGDKNGMGFSEEDEPNFRGSFYSRTKLWSDRMLADFPVLQLRIRMPFEGTGDPRNLITKLLRYDRVLDVPNSLTYVPDFLKIAQSLIQKRATGIYNMVNTGAISPYEVMIGYQKAVDPHHTFERLTLDNLPSVVQAGRSNCMLNTNKLTEEGLPFRPVNEALEEAFSLLRKQREETHS